MLASREGKKPSLALISFDYDAVGSVLLCCSVGSLVRCCLPLAVVVSLGLWRKRLKPLLFVRHLNSLLSSVDPPVVT